MTSTANSSVVQQISRREVVMGSPVSPSVPNHTSSARPLTVAATREGSGLQYKPGGPCGPWRSP
jgi:hypothetical protein